jgi:hypothetical protein
MPQLQIVSLDEAQGQGRDVPDYVALIQQVPQGLAGKLILSEEENPITARKWLVLAAKAMDVPLGIRRRGRTIYFWVESPLLQEQKTGRSNADQVRHSHLLLRKMRKKRPAGHCQKNNRIGKGSRAHHGERRRSGQRYRRLWASASNNDSRNSRKDAQETGLCHVSPVFSLTLVLPPTKIRDIQHTKE